MLQITQMVKSFDELFGRNHHLDFDGNPLDMNKVDEARQIFYKEIKNVRPIVFSSSLFNEIEDRATAISSIGIDEPQSLLGLPFPVCSFEFLNPMSAFSSYRDLDVKHVMTCLLVIEISPSKKMFFEAMAPTKDIKDRGRLNYWSSDDVVTANRTELIRAYLDILNKSAMGVECVREKMRIGHGADRSIHKINQVVRVCPKRHEQHEPTIQGRGIDWSHRWEVRGHWRACSGIGKDRNDIYQMAGFTWVRNHERGPDHLPLVKKTRLRVTSKEIAHL